MVIRVAVFISCSITTSISEFCLQSADGMNINMIKTQAHESKQFANCKNQTSSSEGVPPRRSNEKQESLHLNLADPHIYIVLVSFRGPNNSLHMNTCWAELSLLHPQMKYIIFTHRARG